MRIMSLIIYRMAVWDGDTPKAKTLPMRVRFLYLPDRARRAFAPGSRHGSPPMPLEQSSRTEADHE